MVSYVVPSAEVKSYPLGANSPGKAALMTQQENSDTLNKLGKFNGGKSRRAIKRRRTMKRGRTMKYKRKRGGNVKIYSPHTPYPQQGTGPNSIESIIKNLTSSMMQGQAYAQFDKYSKVGGSRRHRKTKSKRRVKSY
jgi:hypothetical protein